MIPNRARDRAPALAAHDWVTALKVQAVNLSIGSIVGIWAVRASLSLSYPGFQFRWVVAEVIAERSVIELPPDTSAERKL